MTIRIGPYLFDDVDYDSKGDVLYLSIGAPKAATKTIASPEGHAIRYDDSGEVIGITIVNARWISERDGRVTITFPSFEAPAEDLASALAKA